MEHSHWSDVTESCRKRKKDSYDCSRVFWWKHHTKKKTGNYFFPWCFSTLSNVFFFLFDTYFFHRHLMVSWKSGGPHCAACLWVSRSARGVSLIVTFSRSSVHENMHPNQMKGAKAKSKACNLPSVAPLSSLGRCVLPRLRGFFFFLLFFFPPSLVSPSYMQPALGIGESRRFNRDLATSRKPIILAFRKAFIPAHWALNGSDILWWIAAAKWEQERYEGRGGRKQDTGGKKSTRNSLPFLPRGMECVGGTLHIFPIKRVSTLSLSSSLPAHASLSKNLNRVPAEEFLHPRGSS